MRHLRTALSGFAALAVLGGPIILSAQPQQGQTNTVTYPATHTADHVEDYHGTKLPDPYRWLEDDRSAETADWVKRQNEVTFGHLDKIPFRETLRKRLEQVYNYPKISAPSHRKGYFFFSKNDGLQNQSIVYWQKGEAGAPQVLLDPNTWSKDGTTRLAGTALSENVKYLAYSVSVAGSDWTEIRVLDLATGKPTTDVIQWVKVSATSWNGDDGFFYSRYPAPVDTTQKLSAKNENHLVYYHKLGTSQAQDQLVYEDPKNPQRFHFAGVTEDDRYLILNISDRGTGKKGNALSIKEIKNLNGPWLSIITGFDDNYSIVTTTADGKLIVETDKDAPNGKVVLIDPANPAEANWKLLIAEQKEVLDGVGTAGGKLFAQYSKDVTSRVYVYSMDGKQEREVKLPGLGVAGGFGGNREDGFLFYTYNSFNTPSQVYRYDIKTGESKLFRKTEVPFDPSQFEVKQVFFTSKDGTRVPMFIVHKKGLKLNGTNPTWMYGYGGFSIAVRPTFNPLIVPFLEQGGVYVSVNMRGGSEYGEAWHLAGTKEKKQNVFDDFIAGAEWLIANKYTNSSKLAMSGGSNGGLLVGAVMTQRPELFKVALPAVGVMDMLRFHKFTIGWNWIPDYGSSDTPEGFQYLRAYSPLHNLKPGITYPATLVTTADHDDRVVPAHSFKFTAALQAANGGANPTLIRVETNSGHGASNTAKAIAATADQMAFTMYHLGMQPEAQ